MLAFDKADFRFRECRGGKNMANTTYEIRPDEAAKDAALHIEGARDRVPGKRLACAPTYSRRAVEALDHEFLEES
jgi:hypothetical protein